MHIMSLTDTKAHFSAVVNQVIAGDEIIVERMGMPVVKIVPYVPQKKKSIIGLMKGQVTVPKDFDEWPEDIARSFGIIDRDK